MAEKQLPATPRRRQKAREEGQTAHSPELGAALGLLAFGMALRTVGGLAAREIAGLATALWSHPILSAGASGGMAAEAFAVAAGPMMLIPLGAALLGAVGQGGVVLSSGGLMPKLDRINPVSGLQRMFSARTAAELLKSLLKIAVVALVVYGPVRTAMSALENLVGNLPAVAAGVFSATSTVLVDSGGALLALAVMDLLYQRWEFERGLRMSREDLKEEMRETEGDPMVRQQRRRRQRELAQRRMMHDVARADVVVTNPTHYAVALRYVAAEMAAPTVVGKGRGWLAQRLKEVARVHGVSIVENPPLARALYQSVKVGGTITPDLYQAVAELLAFVWRLKGRA